MKRNRTKISCIIRGAWLLLGSLLPLSGPLQAAGPSARQGGEQIALSDGVLTLTPLADNAVRVRYRSGDSPEGIPALPEYIYTTPAAAEGVAGRLREQGGRVELTLPRLRLSCDRSTGRIEARNAAGEVIATMLAHRLTPSTVQGEPCCEAELRFDSPDEEALFGLGQFQDGYTDVRGLSRRLTQVNTQIAIPFVYSTRGFGLLWNNYGLTEFNPSETWIRLHSEGAGGDRTQVDVTSTEGNRREWRSGSRFAATFSVPQSGRYALLLDVGQKMARTHHLAVDGETVISMKNLWLPPTASAIVYLAAGEHRVTAQLEAQDRPRLGLRPVGPESCFRSPVAECVDYTLFAGEADEVIASYRRLTGEAPLMPAWALGYIHCRERFHSQEEILATARRFDERRLPLDVLVQDWQYWGRHGWNAMRFDEEFYPDPKAMTDSLHAREVRFMLSVWSKIDERSEVGQAMQRDGYYLPGTSWIDFFLPEAAAAYWNHFSRNLLLPYGIDAWWQDATEPENDDLEGRRVAGGRIAGERVRNLYPLTVCRTVFEGCRADAPGQRTMILTRSGFPGIQRYGAALWSGDVGHDWETLRRQIAGGLGLSITGLPWWTYDAGGFFRPANQYTDPAYRECFARWLQTAVFLPLMRVHGYMSNTECWNYGPETEQLTRQALALRYRLLPYLYAENARIAFRGGTLLRPLVMDFRTDPEACREPYTFMCGPALLAAPVVEAGATRRSVYLPATAGGWYDLHSGERVVSGEKACRLDAAVTPDRIPVYVRAGAILPLAAEGCTRSTEALQGAWELRIHAGADGSYSLYEDNGTGNEYQQGERATIELRWNDRRRQLTVSARRGAWTGMPAVRPLRIVALLPDGPVEREIAYAGKACVVAFR